MPPKVKAANTEQLTEANLKAIRATLVSLEDFKPDWKRVEGEFGIGKGGNGSVTPQFLCDAISGQQVI
jgi:hypothetical protein